MSKNIVIQEGGIGRQFTAQKLTTLLVDGGNCNWVPEDETRLETKHISQNGTFVAANDGCYGYDKVVVNIVGMSKIITGTDNDENPAIVTVDVDGNATEIIVGDYFIVTYDEDGNVSKIEDNNGNVCELIYDGETLTGFDDANENRYTIVMNNGKITEVINPNGQNCELKDQNNDGWIDIISNGEVYRVVPVEDGIKIIDSNDLDVTDSFDGTVITGDDSKDNPWRVDVTSNETGTGEGGKISTISTTPITTPGASIIGNNSDGDATKITIGDDGGLEQEVLPHHIEITTVPPRTDYYEGQDIVYDGMVVKAFLKDGSLWTNEAHPDGVIPISELTLPLEKAVITGDYDTIWSDESGNINALEVYCSEPGYSGYGDPFYFGGNLGSSEIGICGGHTLDKIGSFLLTHYNHKLYAMSLSSSINAIGFGRFNGGKWIRGGNSSNTYTVKSVPVDSFGSGFFNLDNNANYDGLNFSNVPISTINPSGITDLDLDAKHSTEQVPVQWMYGGVVALETSYEIDVETWPYDTPINEG